MGRVFEKRKHRIFARNAKLSKLFTRIGKEIAMAVKAGGPNPETNTRLRMAVQNARGMNMPKDNVDRAIKKAAGGEGVDFAEITYEGYAPGGVAIFIDAATNNTTRTVANVRSFFSKCDGTLGTSGSLAHVFERKAEFVVENAALKGKDADEFEMEAIDAGADDVIRDEEGFIILAPFTSFGAMAQKLEQLGVETKSAELKRFPLSFIPADLTTARNVMKLVDLLDEDEDVNAVYHNMELSEEVEAELAKG
ncbi:MAG: YebC/PmpR family DNA-binding transcriptional regulator [Flavobacteriales bacterium]|jgi:YebC/PmpR family DNA-binding regulatory protein|nr:YebC/PmpR family DNA-binding transcriptional regulator [Flavobacteriales bacterium]MBK9538959.1 YebC/PmpR family DNA-binding transcriptional regulator [Flavobacteriales bacterium]